MFFDCPDGAVFFLEGIVCIKIQVFHSFQVAAEVKREDYIVGGLMQFLTDGRLRMFLRMPLRLILYAY